MNTYECMYIIQANLSDEETDKANRRMIEEIEKRGGSIVRRDRLGKKRLAYPIQRHDDGVYYLMYFELPPGQISSLREAYRLHQRLLRVLILRRDVEEAQKVRKRPHGERPESEQAPSEKADDAGEAAAEAEGGETEDGGEQEEAPAEAASEDEPARQE